MQNKLMHHDPPAELLKALAAARFQYSTQPDSIYYYVPMEMGFYHCGVVGDGNNGCYEWFMWKEGTLKTSDAAYGMPEAALRDALIEMLG